MKKFLGINIHKNLAKKGTIIALALAVVIGMSYFGSKDYLNMSMPTKRVESVRLTGRAAVLKYVLPTTHFALFLSGPVLISVILGVLTAGMVASLVRVIVMRSDGF